MATTVTAIIATFKPHAEAAVAFCDAFNACSDAVAPLFDTMAFFFSTFNSLNNFYKMNGTDLIIERIFNAPLPLVWKALTENELMKQWYFDLAEFKAENGFKFEYPTLQSALNDLLYFIIMSGTIVFPVAVCVER